MAKCFNALNGLLPFLLLKTSARTVQPLEGFNALNGLLPFLQHGVNAVKEEFQRLIDVFQRPKRASSIST